MKIHMESHDLKLIRKKRREQTNTQSTAKDETKNVKKLLYKKRAQKTLMKLSPGGRIIRSKMW